MDYLQAEALFEAVIVAVVVEKRMLLFNTKSCDQAIDGITNGDSSFAQCSEIPSRGNGQTGTAGIVDLEDVQELDGVFEMFVIPNALKHFHLNHGGNTDPLQRNLLMQPACWGNVSANQIVNDN